MISLHYTDISKPFLGVFFKNFSKKFFLLSTIRRKKRGFGGDFLIKFWSFHFETNRSLFEKRQKNNCLRLFCRKQLLINLRECVYDDVPLFCSDRGGSHRYVRDQRAGYAALCPVRDVPGTEHKHFVPIRDTILSFCADLCPDLGT